MDGWISWSYLNQSTVDQFLQIVQPDDILVDIPSDLKETMRTVRGDALRTERTRTIQTEDIPLILPRKLMH